MTYSVAYFVTCLFSDAKQIQVVGILTFTCIHTQDNFHAQLS